MPSQTLPEIKRVNLACTVLTLKSMRIMDVLNFEFLDRPDEDSLRHALKQLFLLDALDADGRLRLLGECLARLPLEPTFAKALLAAHLVSAGCGFDMARLLGVLSTESVWLGISRHDEQRQKVQASAKERFEDRASDHYSLVEIYDAWRVKQASSPQVASQWCFQNGLQHRALSMAKNISEQLLDQLEKVDTARISAYFKTVCELRRSLNRRGDRSERLRFALSQGFYMQACARLRSGGGSRDTGHGGPAYLTVAEGSFVRVDRQSNLQDESYAYVIYTQLSGMSNRIVTPSQSSATTTSAMGVMRMASAVDVSWVAPLIPKLKDPVDIDRLSGIRRKDNTEESKDAVRRPPGRIEELEAELRGSAGKADIAAGEGSK